uniref:Uncharacterized protein n=1 Tax=Sphaerodactylus townsendi TaxID=933632 RepID=A0ACB8ETF0_9SAUR
MELQAGPSLASRLECLSESRTRTWCPMAQTKGTRLALRWQFEEPFQEKAHPQLWQIWQGSQPVSEYISESRQLARVVQDWPELVKVHFFREGLHPEMAQWSMVAAELTSLAWWYTRAGMAEIHLHRVQLLKQRSSPPA